MSPTTYTPSQRHRKRAMRRRTAPRQSGLQKMKLGEYLESAEAFRRNRE